MIQDNFHAIKSCYDLKGSIFDRNVEIDIADEISGQNGLKVLKDQNFQRKEVSGDGRLNIDPSEKQ